MNNVWTTKPQLEMYKCICII